MAGTTRRGLFARSAQAAGALAALQVGGVQVAQAGVVAQARLNGKLQVVQVVDFHPDHNEFVKKTITDFAAAQRWELDLSDLAGFVGGTDIYQKLQAQKAAGQPVDLIVHRPLDNRLMYVYDLYQDVTAGAQPDRAALRPGSLQRPGRRPDRRQVGRRALLRPHGRLLGARGQAGRDGHRRQLRGTRDLAGRPRRGEGHLPPRAELLRLGDDHQPLRATASTSCGASSRPGAGALADDTGAYVTLYSPETIDGVTWLRDVYTSPANAGILPPGVNSWNDTLQQRGLPGRDGRHHLQRRAPCSPRRASQEPGGGRDHLPAQPHRPLRGAHRLAPASPTSTS